MSSKFIWWLWTLIKCPNEWNYHTKAKHRNCMFHQNCPKKIGSLRTCNCPKKCICPVTDGIESSIYFQNLLSYVGRRDSGAYTSVLGHRQENTLNQNWYQSFNTQLKSNFTFDLKKGSWKNTLKKSTSTRNYWFGLVYLTKYQLWQTKVCNPK